MRCWQERCREDSQPNSAALVPRLALRPGSIADLPLRALDSRKRPGVTLASARRTPTMGGNASFQIFGVVDASEPESSHLLPGSGGTSLGAQHDHLSPR
jgi:hypothetical protein